MRLFKNLFSSPVTSTGGCVAGIPKIIEGVQTHNWLLVIEGLGLLLLGITASEHKQE